MSRPLAFDPIEEAARRWEARWPKAASAMAAATSVVRVQQLVVAAVDAALRPYGLTFARFEALRLLAFSREGALPLSRMGPRLMVHPTSVTNVVDRLEADGLVERVPHPTDRRTTLARITPAGRALVEEATEAVNASGFGLDALGEDQARALVALLRPVRAAAGDFSAQGPADPEPLPAPRPAPRPKDRSTNTRTSE
ncbi:MarR family winged helix-turn-helix transcriptional regulator [Aciditerrimonas ferrireducens]|uniref:MarR family winged helix-turn-helix transcriptional regulator n=1 Tax=Aciditerrimonas ferrireducens TaxID=667306 RepID=UPI0020044BB1|nr:MarR family transcriptional regulator [Aciditerrimonas ferrireducens]MCK4177654.1 MarR family transcriptional regulator [Aciditerrimonas ferrireducens]